VASLKRYVAANVAEEVRRDQVVVLRDAADTPPGQEAQIDYGHLGYWVDPATGRRRRVVAFVMVLACSRHLFVRPVLVMDQRAWTEAHVEAFEFFGGCPARLVPDNLRTGVDRPDLYDPKLNRSYAELAEHYRVLVDPARAGKPRDKGLASHCTSWGICGKSFVVLPGFRWSSDLAERRRLGDEVVVGAFVVAGLTVEQPVVVPAFDGVGAHVHCRGSLVERKQSAVA
jgi:transposase